MAKIVRFLCRMNNSLFKALPPLSKLLFFGGMVLIGFGVGALVIMLITLKGLHIPAEEISAFLSLPDPAFVEAIKWMNNVAQIFGFILPVLLFVLIFGKHDVLSLMNRKPNVLLWFAPFWIISANGIIEFSGVVNEWLIPAGSGLERLFRPQEESAKRLTEIILGAPGSWSFFTTIITVALIPAICEELVFRGVVQPLVARSTKRIHLAVWFTAFLFSFIHFQFYGFIPRLILGAMLGYLVIWSGSIWTAVLGHFANNLVAIISYKFFDGMPEEIGATPDYLYLGISVVACTAIAYFMLKRSKWPWIGFEYLGITNPAAPTPSSGPQA
jgi:hypothetical protein